MGNKKAKGGKTPRRCRKHHKDSEQRELVFKKDLEEYAKVTKMLGNCRLEAMCFDGVKRMCHIRGKLQIIEWISEGDIILVSLRGFQDKKADVIWKYNEDEAKQLKSYGEFPNSLSFIENKSFAKDEADDDIEFCDESSEEN